MSKTFKNQQVRGTISSGAGGARTHDRRIMSPRAVSSRESGTVLTWEYEPARSSVNLTLAS